jgi:hypothetical protein
VNWPVIVVATILWSTLTVCSVRAFWRTSDDLRQSRIYADTKFMSVFVTTSLALLLPVAIPLPSGSYAVQAIYWTIIAFPITLCIGYFAVRLIHSIGDQMQRK